MGSCVSSSIANGGIGFKTVDDCSSCEEAMAVITQALRNDACDPQNYNSRLCKFTTNRCRHNVRGGGEGVAAGIAKVVLRGDSSVGKSNILLGFSAAEDEHPPPQPLSPASNFACISPPLPSDNGLSTIGTVFVSRQILLQEDGALLHSGMRFEVWDTAAQQRFAQSASLACLGASAIVFVYDIAQATTFFKVQQWVQELFEHINLDRGSNFVMALVGNKADLSCTFSPGKEEFVDTATAHSFAKRHGMIFMEMSAETQPDHIKALFVEIGKRLLKPMES